MPQRVTYARIEHIKTPKTRFDLFEFRPKRGWVWLQRICFKILRWIGAYHEEVIHTFTRHKEENSDLMAHLLKQNIGWLEWIYRSDSRGYRPRIYCGPEQQASLMRLVNFHHMSPVTFDCSSVTRDESRVKWHGIPVTVIPWMEGAIIVPEYVD